MDLIKLNIIGLSYSQFKSGAYALFLEEEHGVQKLSIVIGQCEAQAIAIGLDKNIVSPRPLTHDLFITLCEKSNLILNKIIIHKLEKGIFFSSIIFEDTNKNKNLKIDARTSDAVAIAIRLNAPIYTYKKILVQANKYFNTDRGEVQSEISSNPKSKKISTNQNIAQLEKKLATLLDNEDYELAAKIRDQIKKLKNE